MAKLKLNLAELNDRLNAIAKAGKDVSQPLDIIRLKVVAAAKRNFEQSSTPEGAGWLPLKHPRPNSKGKDMPLLDKGLLRSSVTATGAQGNIDVREKARIEWGTNLEYSTIHQYGGEIKPKKAKMLAIPATVDAQYRGSPRNWPEGELEFHWGKNGGVAVTKDPKTLQDVVQYYFTKSVRIPARPYLGITDDQAKEYAELVADAVADQVEQELTK